MDNQNSQFSSRSDRLMLVLVAVLAGASLLIPYALKKELSHFDGLLTGQTYATLLCLFASGLALGLIRPTQSISLAFKLGCMLAVTNAMVALVQCPG